MVKGKAKVARAQPGMAVPHASEDGCTTMGWYSAERKGRAKYRRRESRVKRANGRIWRKNWAGLMGFVSAIAACALLAMSAVATAGGDAADSAMANIQPEAIRAHMRFLADDLLEGRGTATRGHEIAAKYMAAQFEKMGLSPAGENGTYFQVVPLRQGRP